MSKTNVSNSSELKSIETVKRELFTLIDDNAISKQIIFGRDFNSYSSNRREMISNIIDIVIKYFNSTTKEDK